MPDEQEHLARVQATLEEGDIVQFVRKKGKYSHFGIYIGNGEVIHKTTGVTASSKSFNPSYLVSVSGITGNKGYVEKEPFLKVAAGCKAKKNNSKDAIYQPRPVADILRDLEVSRGKANYSVLTDNCEHFVNMMRYGVKKSDQVDDLSRKLELTKMYLELIAGAMVTLEVKWLGSLLKNLRMTWMKSEA